MRRYKTRAEGWCEDDLVVADEHVSMTVHDEDEERFTGLYDATGTPIYRVRNPIGFNLG